MMADNVAIKIEKVSKMYKIFDSHSHRLWDAVNIFGRSSAKEFWALKDINVEITKGSTVGILGQNGSGKSTLLQLITSVLQPTFGTITVKGRIAALLELGAGFNPNLTGRENVIMNGMIMGLSKDEILAKMELIQGFADIGEFFDQPMRTCSSGMFMRVAFSAAIHVDPDILIIDEALSVGDAKFQEKCFRRFRHFQESGKTILLVTHDRSAVPRLCDVALLLNKGKLIEFGSPKRIVDLYSNVLATGDITEYVDVTKCDNPEEKVDQNHKPNHSQVNLAGSKLDGKVQQFLEDQSSEDQCFQRKGYNPGEYRYGNGKANILDYLAFANDRAEVTHVECGENLTLFLKIYFHQDIDNPLVGISIRNTQGILVYGLNSEWLQYKLPKVYAGSICTYKFTIAMNLRPGPWFLEFAVAASHSDLCDVRSNIVQIDVLSGAKSFDGLVYLESVIEVLS